MKHVKTIMIASVIALSCVAGNVVADSWTIVQDALTLGAATLKQTTNTSGGSVQAINNINLNDKLSTTVGDVTQTINISTLNMHQNATKASIQAGNALITAASGTGEGTIKQSLTVDTLNMTQTTATGSHQAANYVGIKLW